MTACALDTLVHLCPPPSANPLPTVDWARAEQSLGTALPADYKRLVEAYGDGVFDETLWLLVPDSAYAECDLHAQRAERDDILADLWESGEKKPAALLEAGARVLPWAHEEGTGAFLYWLARPDQHPDEWTVLYNEGRGPMWEHHDTGCVAFLLAVLTGTAETAYFGHLYEELQLAEHRFETADETLGAAR
ncbi:SMI1/KNR4 family protein [Streptomyces erythrochromogenes]|uniref:SMI1/KNR4 family protein n=1 Tax=Streptomyces erythrochromogenes TaxID=285574 RepID=UPI00224D8E57|nr:SMI1/KNR4 family protein [Streptomyces erythrochromogenes]MCX5583313.1 SMI1/KNR4 family protein [Streptomyces erythrochromogenes]